MEKNIKIQGHEGQTYIYHDPCHSQETAYNPLEVTNTILGQETILSDRCCGESGTFAAGRPDIASQVKMRKQEEIEKDLKKIDTVNNKMPTKILTSCPSCLQGLSRYGDDTNTEADYIVVEIAKHVLGEQWLEQYVEKAKNGGIEKILL